MKMVKKMTLAIVALSIVAILGWGFWLGMSITTGIEMGLLEIENETLKSGYNSLDASYNKLTESYDKLEGDYAELKSDHTALSLNYETLSWNYKSLNASYNELRESYDRLSTSYDDLGTNHSELKSKYSTLEGYYSTLYSRYNSLKEDYDQLSSIMESGVAIAESATWLSEDERLEVTSKLIPEYYSWSQEISSYDVKVTVTNVGDQPLDVVWIFLFPYVDGKLCEYWSAFSYAHDIESLYMGESYSYTFTWITADMTSYRVLVIGG